MKTAIVTGGSKGIGYGIAESLIKEGWRVAITGRTQNTLDDAITKLLQIRKGHAMDALIANAGIGYFGSIETLSPEQWHETMDTNLTGVFYSI